MGINTDLNVDPYYDDFDEAKQFNKVLFKPAKAVQARELTQLQTILQKQVERFGTNIYKEGTIISGVNLTARDDLFFVKLNDKVGFSNPAVYDQVINDDGTTTTFTVQGSTSGLTAEVIKGENGFQTQAPDLKTFYVKYLNSNQDNDVDVKRFIQGEILTIRDSNGGVVGSVTVNDASGHEGRSFGISCEEGVIYQKGHFIFVDNQFIIANKYSNVPGNVSVGFAIKENLIDSDQDTTLLDNASGFNNENAPGADRLQLVPTLVSYPTSAEPTEFFSLIRYVGGQPVRIRDRTEFNIIGNELARRTYEESGNYVVNGLNVTLEREANTAYAVLQPGKAYIYGKEITKVSPTKLEIDPLTATQSKIGQRTGVSYGQYYEFNGSPGESLPSFVLTGGETGLYLLFNNGTLVGRCGISNITTDGTVGRIYVYAITKIAGQETTAPNQIGISSQNNIRLYREDTGFDSSTGTFATTKSATTGTQAAKLYESNKGCMIFDTGKDGMSTHANVSVTRRIRQSISGNSVTLSAADGFPLTGNMVAVSTTGSLIEVTGSSYADDNEVSVTLGSASSSALYYDRVDAVEEDTLSLETVYVKSIYNSSTKKALLGVPNVVEIVSIQTQFGSQADGSEDVTSKFRLVSNQKDGFYDISYIALGAGEELLNNDLLIRFKYLRRNTSVNGGYLSVDSYESISEDEKHLIQAYVSKEAREYNLLDCFDFRPYARNMVTPSTGANADIVTASELVISPREIVPALNSTISSDQTYFMARMDSVVLDEYSNVKLIKGGEDENPKAPKLDSLYRLANIKIPGATSRITGPGKITVTDVSTQNYRMEDIGRIEKRIDSLVDIVSLSLLEAETNSMLIPDENGADRFKNGILADAFANVQLADILDPEFKSSLDRGRTVVTPSVKQFPVDLKASTGDGVQLSFPDVVTMAKTGTNVNVINQPYATSFRNCVSNFYDFRGRTIIDPPFDSGYDVIKNPEVNLEIDIEGPMLDLLDNIQEIMPITSEELLSEERISTQRTRRGRRRVRTGTFLQDIETKSLTSSSSQLNQAVGNFVTDVNMKPYLRRKEIKILITGLRPSTRHYFFFDEVDVNEHVAPARNIRFGRRNSSTLDVKRVSSSWRRSKGRVVRSDSNGVLAAVFMIPAETFFVGENVLEVVDVDEYNSIESGSTSYGKATYRGYNFAVNKSSVSMTTRTVDFDTQIDIVQREVTRRIGDPIAQTFKVKSSSTEGSNVAFISDIDVYFKRKSATTGVTLQIREVQNGYPSKNVLPFASKHHEPSEVYVSDDGTMATKFTFDNPVRLNADKEYSFVVIPDANSPDYLIHTAKVGEISKSKGSVATQLAITNDWGDGVLFTSTNDSAWKSYQDEDIKFSINRYDFSTTNSTVDLEPNDPEFINIRDVSGNFLVDEIAYVKKSQTFSASVSGDDLNIITISGSPGISIGDYIHIENNTATDFILAKVLNVDTEAAVKVFTVDTPFSEATLSAQVTLVVAGKVSHFNPRKPHEIFLRGSSAVTTNYLDDEAPVQMGSFDVGTTYTITDVSQGDTSNADWRNAGVSQNVTPAVGVQFVCTDEGNSASSGMARPNSQIVQGSDSGASAGINGVKSQKISYFQPQIYVADSLTTNTSLSLLKGDGLIDKEIDKKANVYTTNNIRSVHSKSHVESNPSASQDFKIRVELSNNGVSTATPIIDKELSEIQGYEYHITNTELSTSNWVTKEVILKEDLNAVGMRVYLAAYRPAGTFVDVYGRFTYPTIQGEDQGQWYQLTNKNPDLYSNTSNTKDYRQFEYNLPETVDSLEYSTFQLKFVLRHGNTSSESELNNPRFSGIVPDVNLFPHIYDYRAIALT